MLQRTALLLLLAVAQQGALADKESAARAPGSLTQNITLGLYSVDVTADFAEVTNLNAITLGLTGQLIDPLLDLPGLVARLPAAGVSIPTADFPVLVDITPPAVPPLPDLGLEFEGVAMITLDTSNLPYSPGTRLRLFSAHDGGDFVDITEEVSEGSYRVRGSQGEFSEFLIVEDNRDPDAIVTTKFARLTGLMSTHSAAIDDTVEATLNSLLTTAQSSYAADDIDAAKVDVTAFIAAVDAATPGQIPNLWRSLQDVTNVNGILRAAAGTLLFSLEDARDTDLDGVYDFADNCLTVTNPTQCDSNGDGFGNHCDADLNNDNIVNSFDLSILRQAFGSSSSPDADLNCDGMVNSFDLTIMRTVFGQVPGPAAP